MSRMNRSLVLLLVSLSIVACTTTAPKNTPPAAIPNEVIEPSETSLIVLADAQINENHGLPTFWESEWAVHRLGQTVARRSVQQTVFGDQLLAATVDVATKKGSVPVVFLGDAMNMSCQSEYHRFSEAMRASGATWIAAPGNHDGFYSGISQPTIAERYKGKIVSPLNPRYGRDRDVWEWVCPSGVMVKSSTSKQNPGFVETYVRDLLSRNSKPSTVSDGLDGCHQRSWETGLLRDLVWCTEEKRAGRYPWQAFVVQRLMIPFEGGGFPVLVADSSVYAKEPCLTSLGCSNSGLVGGLGSEQRKILDAWVYRAKQDKQPFVLMMHHPVAALEGDTADINWIEHAKSYGLALVVTAHTHNGCVRAPLDLGGKAPLELNIGSVIDDQASYTELVFSDHHSSPQVSYRTKEIDAGLLGFPQASMCAAHDDDLDSIVRQVSGTRMGPYAAQLSQVQAELALVRRNLQRSTGFSTWQKKIDIHMDAVRRALDVAEKRCNHYWQVTAVQKIQCERRMPVALGSGHAKATMTVREVAINAQRFLATIERSPEWTAFLASADNRNLAACQAVVGAKSYWAGVTGSPERSPDSQCIPHPSATLYP